MVGVVTSHVTVKVVKDLQLVHSLLQVDLADLAGHDLHHPPSDVPTL